MCGSPTRARHRRNRPRVGQHTLGAQLICHFYSPSHSEEAWKRTCKLQSADMSKQTCSLPLSWRHIPVTWKFCEQSEADTSQAELCSYMTRTTLAAMMAQSGSSSTTCPNRHEQAVVAQLPCHGYVFVWPRNLVQAVNKPTRVTNRGCATLTSRHSQLQAHFWEQHYELQETDRIKQELLRSLLLFV